MISLKIFIISIAFLVLVVIGQIGRFYRQRKKAGQKNQAIIDWLAAAVYSKTTVIVFLAVISIFALGSVVPYLLQEADKNLITAYSNSSWAIDKYIDEYVVAAEKNRVDKVIIAARAAQLRDKMIDQNLVIYKAKAKIEAREANKWFFWIE